MTNLLEFDYSQKATLADGVYMILSRPVNQVRVVILWPRPKQGQPYEISIVVRGFMNLSNRAALII